ncbi:MAG TPA: TIGR00282 family metallophosphoesterase [Candidatus Saccharimonadales bacterium]|jgi:metallophosphoesterase (TIGR00282 family)|nr:TIGR00282 family metallophosphoesterase [Candidatus Saccharimonadales bacterium]
MNILYVGDIYGRPGIEVVQQVLPRLRQEKQIDFVVAQGENVSNGRSLLPADMQTLQAAGVDFFTGGNWSLFSPEAAPLLSDPNVPAIRPANYPEGTPGLGWKVASTPRGKVLVISLLGDVVGRDAGKAIDNPLLVVDKILAENQELERVAAIVNLHGDFSSQKVIIGHYLDGRVTAVVGDHWHVPTADARVLPMGTAHMSDVGMCGTLDSSLGVKLSVVIPRWRDGKVSKNEIETEGPRQFNALLIHSDDGTGLARGVEPVRQII